MGTKKPKTGNDTMNRTEIIQGIQAQQDPAGLLCEAYSFFNDNAINTYLRVMIGTWRYSQ
jgi:hypothetical protein